MSTDSSAACFRFLRVGVTPPTAEVQDKGTDLPLHFVSVPLAPDLTLGIDGSGGGSDGIALAHAPSDAHQREHVFSQRSLQQARDVCGRCISQHVVPLQSDF